MKFKSNIKFLITIIIFLASVVFFVLGIVTPILSTKVHVIWMDFKKTNVSLIDSVVLFYESKDYFLSAIILLFTFVFPIAKYIEIIVRLVTGNMRKNVLFDKWNMLDVFIVALLLVNFKMGDSLIVMNLQLGTLYLSLSVLTRIITIELMDRCNGKK